jgi:hypothetical protein
MRSFQAIAGSSFGWLLASIMRTAPMKEIPILLPLLPESNEVLTPFPTLFRRYLYGGLVNWLLFATCAMLDDVFYANTD